MAKEGLIADLGDNEIVSRVENPLGSSKYHKIKNHKPPEIREDKYFEK